MHFPVSEQVHLGEKCSSRLVSELSPPFPYFIDLKTSNIDEFDCFDSAVEYVCLVLGTVGCRTTY